MNRATTLGTACLALLLASPTARGGGGWVTYVEETDTRLVADGTVGANDVEEKDYIWGDLDNDGDIDLVCVRKEPFTTTGKEANVLFMNEGGVLVDRTQEYASASDVADDRGFLTPTNDRDVWLSDVDGDGWLDVITATTLSDYDPKYISHPRIYMNLGEQAGVWLGLRHEDARIPQMHATAGPRFCSVAAGDLTGDGAPDLYFGDYDSGDSQIYDYNNRLLINDGKGFFTDESAERMNSTMLLSAFGAASVIADMNGDGVNDVIKQTSLNPPQHVSIVYNDLDHEGYFDGYEIHDENAPYFVSVGDLNGDGMLDMVVTDDGSDRVYLNTGNGGDGFANFSSKTLENSNGFGSNIVIEDLNNDGNNDIIIADVDVDISGCSRYTHIYRNLGNVPDVSFSEQATGIPSSMLQGVHDVAVFDLNGDGWQDLVIGRCSGTEIWMNQAPEGLVFTYPLGLPAFVAPDEPHVFEIAVEAFGGGSPAPGTGHLFTSVNGKGWVDQALEPIGKYLYRATLPAVACADHVDFYLTHESVTGILYTDPPGAPASSFRAVAAEGLEIVLRDDIEGDVSGWSVVNDGSLSTGAWEQADPNGTIYNGEMAAPEDDATAGEENVRCFVTQNGVAGGSAGTADVDGGPTTLLSPVIDLAGTDGVISYSRWMYDSVSEDAMQTWISNDGGASWSLVHEIGGTGGAWESVNFVVGEHVTPSSAIVVAFSIEDANTPSIVEAGVDNFQVEVYACDEQCPADVDGSGTVDVSDVLYVLSAWGSDDTSADVDGSGTVEIGDLLAVIAAWGPCS